MTPPAQADLRRATDTGVGHPLQPEAVAADLLALLSSNAPSDAFSRCLADLQALPDRVTNKQSLIELARMAMGLRNQLDQHEQRERGMLAVIESAQDLSARLDLPELLKAIVTRARDLLRANLCWLTIFDADLGEFKVVVADGAIATRTGKMTAKRNLGVAGIVMSTRMPFSTPDYLHDNRFAHDADLDDIFRDEGIAALVGAPLIWNDEVIGLLFVADRYHRTHTALNVSILCTLATHAAVAINNAKAFSYAQSAVDRADDARAELERHTHDVQAAAEAHERLTSLLARGASLSELCQSVAQLLQGNILVLDETHQVIARADAPDYDGHAADRYEPYGPHSAALTRALGESRRAGRSTIAYETDDERCRAIAVIGGDGVLGAVLLFRKDDMRDSFVRTFERSSSVIGIVLLSQERMAASKSRAMSDLMQTLISPRLGEPALTRDRTERFGLDLTQPVVLMLVALQHAEPRFLAGRLRTALQVPGLVLDEVDGVLTFVCNATHASELHDALESHLRRAAAPGFCGVLSHAVHSAAELPTRYAALRRALAVVGRLGMRGRIVAQSEMAVYSVLFESENGASLTQFLATTIGAVVDHDRNRGTSLTPTLLAFFDNRQNASVTATQLGIHVNTMRQRLGSIGTLIGSDWNETHRALEVHIALRLWRLGVSEQRDADD